MKGKAKNITELLISISKNFKQSLRLGFLVKVLSDLERGQISLQVSVRK